MTDTDPYDRLRTLLEGVPEYRSPHGLRHPISDVLFIILVGVVCGHEDAEAIEDFAHENEDWFAQRCGLRHGIPSQDTYLRVLAGLNPEAFETAFRAWVDELWKLADNRHIAIDGKTLRRSFDRAAGISAIHSVAAFVSDHGLVIASVPVESKENEIVAIPKLLRLIDIHGATVTIDAIGCQTAIAKEINEAGGNYLLHVKDNQPTLRKQIEGFFLNAEKTQRPLDDPMPIVDRLSEVEKGHGRIESRKCEVSKDLSWVDMREAWADLTNIVKVTRITDTISTKSVRTDVAFYISNDPSLDAARAMVLCRRHWAIENEMHWVLDVTFDEDQSRIRVGNAAKNFATMRRAALNLITTAPSPRAGKSKISAARRRRIASMNIDYRETVLRLRPAKTLS